MDVPLYLYSYILSNFHIHRGEVKCSVCLRKALVKSRMGSLNFVLQKTLLLSTYLPLNTKEKNAPPSSFFVFLSPLHAAPLLHSMPIMLLDKTFGNQLLVSYSGLSNKRAAHSILF